MYYDCACSLRGCVSLHADRDCVSQRNEIFSRGDETVKSREPPVRPRLAPVQRRGGSDRSVAKEEDWTRRR